MNLYQKNSLPLSYVRAYNILNILIEVGYGTKQNTDFLLERITMSDQYFKHLNYTLANEDSALEYQILPESSGHLFCVCGSGSRVSPLLAKLPQKITLVDYSSEQISLTKLRLAAIKELNHGEYLKLLGYQDAPISLRQNIFHNLKLDDQARQYLKSFFEHTKWRAPIYEGKYEKALIKISTIIQKTFGKRLIQKMQHISTQSDFNTFIQNEFPKRRWMGILFLLGNSSFMNAILYEGSLPQKNISESYYQYYEKIFKRLFNFLTPKESFFLQMVFFGKLIDLRGAPLEADANLFHKMQRGLNQTQIQFFQGELVNIIKSEINSPLDFISFSDTLSYFPEAIENSYLQQIKHRLNPGALTIHRYYLRKHFNLNTDGFLRKTSTYKQQIDLERTQIYDVEIYQKE